MSSSDNRGDGQFALIVQQDGAQQRSLMRSTALVVNYQYGLDILVAHDLERAAALCLDHRRQLRATFIINQEATKNKKELNALGLMGAIPVVILCPLSQQGNQLRVTDGMDHVFVCPWERVFGLADSSLQKVVAEALADSGTNRLWDPTEAVSYDDLQKRTQRRLKHLNTIPTLPEVVLRLMRLVSDPQTTNKNLETVVSADPALVWKLLQVMKSPVFGAGRSDWTLGEIIARLGRRKVGCIAQQIALINSLVRPEESAFDLRRFWGHSVGTAMIADRIYSEGMVTIDGGLEFDDYWIGSLMHDIGKLILGFFFWDWFERVHDTMTAKACGFRQAEVELGDFASHQQIGRLLILKENMGAKLAVAVGTHHEVGDEPSPLVSLVHLANNVCKDLGWGYQGDEAADYDPAVLSALNLSPDKVRALVDHLGETVIQEIVDMVDQCV